MNLLLFLVMFLISFTIVRIGAVALELTGLEWGLAKFQALSLFTGTGFTTRESELIAKHPQRRKIASTLMILGFSGIVTLIATFANVMKTNLHIDPYKVPFVNVQIPHRYMPAINLIIIIITLYIFYKLFSHTKVATKFTDFIKSQLLKRGIVKPVTFEILLPLAEEYVVACIEIGQDSSLLNESIAESKLDSHGITLLAVERNEKIIPSPAPESKIHIDDKLICFGKLSNLSRRKTE